jgi:hypothetical protein
VVAVFEAFLLWRPEPPFVRWRDITELLGGPTEAEPSEQG